MANKGLVVDTLFVGCTRPTTIAGVPYSAFIVEVMVAMEAFIFTHNLLNLLWIIPAHGICYLICLREPRMFELLGLWGYTKGSAFVANWRYWRTNSYSPMPLQISRSKIVSRRHTP